MTFIGRGLQSNCLVLSIKSAMKILTGKYLILNIGVLLLFSLCPLFADGIKAASAIENELKGMKRISRPAITGTDGGGKIEFWISGDAPRKINLWIGLSSKEVKISIFYSEVGKIIAISEQIRWFSLGQNDEIKSDMTERISISNYIYDENEKLIRDQSFISSFPNKREVTDEDSARLLKLGGRLFQLKQPFAPEMDLENLIKN